MPKPKLRCDKPLERKGFKIHYIVGDYKGRAYQILVTYEDGIDFESSTDLPSLNYQGYSDSMDETPKSADREVEPTTTKERLSSDYWIMTEDGLLIRKHIIPKTNLYDPDFDHDPIKDLSIKEMCITHVQCVIGKSEIVCDQWAQPNKN